MCSTGDILENLTDNSSALCTLLSQHGSDSIMVCITCGKPEFFVNWRWSYSILLISKGGGRGGRGQKCFQGLISIENYYSKTCLQLPPKKKTKNWFSRPIIEIGFQDQLLL